MLSEALQRNAKHTASLSNISDPLLSAEQNDLRVKALREIETAASELKYKEPRYSEHLEQMTGR
jgi:hypothetical protein